MEESNQIVIKIKFVSDKMPPLPFYATSGSAGMDLAACINKPVTIAPNQQVKIGTGLAIQLPSSNYAALILIRSGLATKHGICLSNGVGLLDSDFTGEIQLGLYNSSKEEYTIYPGDRIAQIVFISIAKTHFELVEELTPTSRGEGGFGSTGITNS